MCHAAEVSVSRHLLLRFSILTENGVYSLLLLILFFFRVMIADGLRFLAVVLIFVCSSLLMYSSVLWFPIMCAVNKITVSDAVYRGVSLSVERGIFYMLCVCVCILFENQFYVQSVIFKCLWLFLSLYLMNKVTVIMFV